LAMYDIINILKIKNFPPPPPPLRGRSGRKMGQAFV
jgi:hypothetical protein